MADNQHPCTLSVEHDALTEEGRVSPSPRQNTLHESFHNEQPGPSGQMRPVISGSFIESVTINPPCNEVHEPRRLARPCDDVQKLHSEIFLCNTKPIKRGKEIYLGYKKHVAGIIQDLAIKLVQNTDDHGDEVKILLGLDSHPNVIKIIDSGICGGDIPRIFLAMELCPQNLHEYIDNNDFNLSKATSFFRQTVSAIAYIHSKKIAHRDLKPTNILVDKGTIKVSDFGVSKQLPDDQTKFEATVAGTEGFKAPECYMGGRMLIGCQTDIYPLAINGYYIFTHGKHPFGLYSFEWVYNIARDRNRNLTLVPPFPESQSHKRSQLIHLFKRMLEYDPKLRPTAEQVEQDAFFNESCLGSTAGGIPTTSSVDARDTMQKSILKIRQESCQDKLPEEFAKSVSMALITASEKLKNGEPDQGINLVKRSIPKSLSADDVNTIGKKLEENHPVCAIIMHRIACLIYKPQDVSPEDAVDWISDRAADIRCTAEQIIELDSGEMRDIAINVCPKFLKELLHDLRSVKDARGNHRAKCEASCIISISRININAANYPDVRPDPNMIKICEEGLASYEAQFGSSAHTKEYYGYMLNNIGEVYMQLGNLDKAERYFKTAIGVKKESTFRRRDAKLRTIGVTERNLQECNLRKLRKTLSSDQ